MTATSETPSTSESGTTATGENPLHWLDEHVLTDILSGMTPYDLFRLSATCRREREIVLRFCEQHGDEELLRAAILVGRTDVVEACIRGKRTTWEKLLSFVDPHALFQEQSRFRGWYASEEGERMVTFLLDHDYRGFESDHRCLFFVCASVGNTRLLTVLLDWPVDEDSEPPHREHDLVRIAVEHDDAALLRWFRASRYYRAEPGWTWLLRLAIGHESLAAIRIIGGEWNCDLGADGYRIIDAAGVGGANPVLHALLRAIAIKRRLTGGAYDEQLRRKLEERRELALRLASYNNRPDSEYLVAAETLSSFLRFAYGGT